MGGMLTTCNVGEGTMELGTSGLGVPGTEQRASAEGVSGAS